MAESVKLIPRELRDFQFPEASFLTQEQQAKYVELGRPFGEKARASLNVGLKGSNLWKVLLLNQNGIRTASIQELDLLAESNPELVRETYEDASAVVLRSNGDSHAPNDYFAKTLAKLIKRRSFPHAVVIEGLKTKEDKTSEYGLSCEKRDNFMVIEAPAFDNANHKRRFKRINPDYTIDFDDKGERTLYTRKDGVSRLYFLRDLGLDSGGEGLADSNGNGRVVVVSGEATAKNLDKYITQRKAVQEKYLANVKALRDNLNSELKGK